MNTLQLPALSFLLFAALLFSPFLQAVESGVETSPSSAVMINADGYQLIDVDRVIKKLSKPGDKNRYFINPVPVRFTATLMKKPRPGQFELVYEALKAWNVSPLPKVGHGAYLKTKDEYVIPVYLERRAAEFINKKMNVKQQAEFYALHIYNYEKGPRFLVVSVNQQSVK